MGSISEPQPAILHFGTPDLSITADQRGFFAFPSYKTIAKTTVSLHDVRTASEVVQGADGLDLQGFAYIDHRSELSGKWFEGDNIERIYLRECEELIKSITGAKRAVASNCSLRRRTVGYLTEPGEYVPRGCEIDQNLAKVRMDKCTVLGKELSSAREPARIVHIDYSVQGLQDSARYCRPDICSAGQDSLAAEDAQSGEVPRYAAYSVWRPISTVNRDPLAVCDWRTVDRKDLVAIQYRNPSSVNESGEYIMEAYNVVQAAQQRWYWAPRQREDEVLVIKFADTGAGGAIAEHCLHGSPIVPGTEEEKPRESIEVRVLAFW